jgi:hypothetical protein
MIDLEPHALAAPFPPIPDDQLQALANIRQHGQREPVLTFESKILDGWNRVRACRLINRKAWPGDGWKYWRMNDIQYSRVLNRCQVVEAQGQPS